MDTLLQDVRYALRTLTRSPGFTAVAVLSLALGIGANTSVFSLVNALYFRPLPFHDPGRLVDVSEHHPREVCDGCGVGTSYAAFRDWKAAARSFASMSAYLEQPVTVAGGEAPERVTGAAVSHDLWATLGVPPALGRGFVADEDRPGGAPVAIIGHELWERRFGADPRVLGRAVVVNGAPHTIVGVMPPRFRFPARAEVWTPIAPALHGEGYGAERMVGVVARLAGGVPHERAGREMEMIGRRMAAEHPATHAGWSARVVSLRDDFSADAPAAFGVLLAAVACVLLIACANLAGLLLARAAGRTRELAVRAALGARRGRIVRQLLTESLLIALAGGVLGVLLAFWGVDLAAASIDEPLPFWVRIGIDGRVLAFALAASVLTGLAFGVAPALRASRPDLQEALKDGARGATGGRRGGRLRSALVVAEVALSLLLLAGAGLMVKTFARVSRVDLRYDPRTVLTADVALLEPRYDDPAQVALFAERAEERLARLPGARTAAVQGSFFIAGFGAVDQKIQVEGRAEVPDGASPRFGMAVTPGYFAALDLPLVAGRGLTARDRAGAPGVAVVNQAMAERLWPGESPLGRRIRLGQADTLRWLTVVGVVANTARSGPGAGRPPGSAVYVPLAQTPVRPLGLLVRAAGDAGALAPALRRALAEIEPNQALTGVQTMEAGLRQRIWPVRMFTRYLGGFAAFAVLLAAIGIYGIVAHAVSQRTHEIGVRMALGARAADVLRLVLRQGVALGAVGVALGIPAALAATRVLRSLLFGTDPVDPLTLAAVTVLLMAVVIAASWIPARRATRVDPMVALRAE